MIAKLKGLVDSLGEDWVVLDVNGVGYLVFASSKTLAKLAKVGEACSLLIETHVREDHIHLYGFADAAERDWFKLLTTVQGVGAKVGLALLSALSAEDIVHAIAAQDKKALTQANGVGPKVATRILTELKDKAGAIALSPTSSAGADSSSQGGTPSFGGAPVEAASALVNLGYGRSEALAAVSKANKKLGGEGQLQDLIREALAELSLL
ncbi:Holliday junction ATP-dependent DNA helicase RuvA [Candidatus Terasakiella magnetica]|uniref:Holliday junction branch migration complex subunit RuvA n=1 Tax=Candidatus Terasakiella magnetica TaxID=1867952 RepID=A0A1C3RHP2_9PROT|nr:Holliday junction branch migration protein RuvA [Candidatus Terasakiella magnetica]SCA56796.1 Holliday junction ATP-dependent DNA helicase RuvA [Candidatus Terasakiella magnetica]